MEYDIIWSFEQNYPRLHNEVVDFQILNRFDLIAIYEDGSKLLYDDFEKTIRILRDEDDLTESECRRKFGEKLRKLLYRKGITQIELAQMIGVKPAQLSGYILGKNTPGFFMVTKIAKALNCSVDEFTHY